MKTKIIIVSYFLLAGLVADAAPPLVTNVTAGQQNGTKLVNVNYTLALDATTTAFVELWFSYDNGLTYPIHCSSVTGDVDQGVTGGTKTAVWDAGADWNHQFTEAGKIRVIATYGDEPSGYNGGGGEGAGSGDANLVTVQWDVFWDWQAANWVEVSDSHAQERAKMGGVLDQLKVDRTEVSIGQWNEVVQWAQANGYTELPLSAEAEAFPDRPMTGITFWQALKWCNARSEMEGLAPAYFQDTSETLGDWNGDGNFINGQDSFDPNFHDQNGNGRWDGSEPFVDTNSNGIHEPGEEFDDLNENGVWDGSEPFVDVDNNGVFDGGEYMDLNSNLQHDAGRTQVFRTGANIPDYGTTVGGGLPGEPTLDYMVNSIDWGANGYRLMDHSTYFMLTTGGNHQKMWPWGDDAPASFADLNQHVLTSFFAGGATAPDVVGSRLANGYGIKNLIGNVAEWSENAWDDGPQGVVACVFGGSFLGLGTVDFAVPSAFDDGIPGEPTSLFDLRLFGPPNSSSPAIGLRCIRYKD